MAKQAQNGEPVTINQQIACVERAISGLQPVVVPIDGHNFMIDAEDLMLLAMYPWRVAKSGHRVYLARWVKALRARKFFHREVIAEPNGKLVDHIHGDTHDNRKHNLRPATHQQNNHNQTAFGSTSRYIGVSFSRQRGTWIASLKAGSMKKHSAHKTELEAALARDVRARQYHGEFARLNFPDCDDNAAEHLRSLRAVLDSLREIATLDTAPEASHV